MKPLACIGRRLPLRRFNRDDRDIVLASINALLVTALVDHFPDRAHVEQVYEEAVVQLARCFGEDTDPVAMLSVMADGT